MAERAAKVFHLVLDVPPGITAHDGSDIAFTIGTGTDSPDLWHPLRHVRAVVVIPHADGVRILCTADNAASPEWLPSPMPAAHQFILPPKPHLLAVGHPCEQPCASLTPRRLHDQTPHWRINGSAPFQAACSAVVMEKLDQHPH